MRSAWWGDGWGEDPKNVEAVISRDAEVLAAFREAMKHQGERTDFVDNVNEVMGRPDGNSRAYSIARVQRECDPETVAAVRRGDGSDRCTPRSHAHPFQWCGVVKQVRKGCAAGRLHRSENVRYCRSSQRFTRRSDPLFRGFSHRRGHKFESCAAH